MDFKMITTIAVAIVIGTILGGVINKFLPAQLKSSYEDFDDDEYFEAD